MPSFTRPRRLRVIVASLALIGLVWVTAGRPQEVSISLDQAKETIQEAYKSVSSQTFNSYWGDDNEDPEGDLEGNDESINLNGESGELVDTTDDVNTESFNDAVMGDEGYLDESDELKLVNETVSVATESDKLSGSDIGAEGTDDSLPESQFDSGETKESQGDPESSMTLDTTSGEIKQEDQEEDKDLSTSPSKETLKGSDADESNEDVDSGSSKATSKGSKVDLEEEQEDETEVSKSPIKGSKDTKGSKEIPEQDTEEDKTFDSSK